LGTLDTSRKKNEAKKKNITQKTKTMSVKSRKTSLYTIEQTTTQKTSPPTTRGEYIWQ